MEKEMLSLKKLKFYGLLICRWVSVSVIVGITGGLVGSLFVLGVEKANEIWAQHKMITWLLPVAGIIIVAMYHLCDFKKIKGTNRILEKVRADEEVPVIVAPLMFFSTIFTHFFGGSAGREGAAVQIGGSIGSGYAKYFKVDDKDASLIVLSGVAAVFAALFGTPVTSVFFALEVVSVGTIYYSGLVPCLVAAMTSYGISYIVGIRGHRWDFVKIPDLGFELAIKVAIIGIMSALLSVAIVIAFSQTKKIMERFITNDYLRVVVGGMVILALSWIFSSGDYNGSGVHVIEKALAGDANNWDFAVKLLFTAITLAAGFKGGEIVPTFFMGATMGVIAGNLLGMDPGFAAAVALVATFCGAVNSPIASIILSIELFGGMGIGYFAIACAVSYSFSGYYSLYSSQKIVYSKTKAKYVNARTRN